MIPTLGFKVRVDNLVLHFGGVRGDLYPRIDRDFFLPQKYLLMVYEMSILLHFLVG